MEICRPGFRAFALVATAVAGCGGNGDEVGNTPPQPVIIAPAEGTTFRAGDTLTISAGASDAQDGTLGSNRLVWWVDLHHDSHAHPFAPETSGGSGRIDVPRRGETSSNVFLRIHVRATDSDGNRVEVTRDVLPQKADITLISQPAGLQLSLDGQPFAAPRTVTGVVGLERDIGAANQVFNGRSYQFSQWSDGGAAVHVITTPGANTTLTAVFIDLGPAVNTAPTVALSTPADGSSGTVDSPITLGATAADSDGSVASVQFFDGNAPIGGADTTLPYSVNWIPSSTGVHTLTARATDNRGATTTSAAVSVTINPPTGADVQPPTVSVSAPAAFANALSGTVTFSANASDNVGVANVEFQVDGEALAVDTSSPYSTSVDTMLHASGQHVLRARAVDSAGNRSEWTSVVVQFGGTRAVPAGVTRQVAWARGLNKAAAFTQLPDGRLLVAEQTGALRVVQADGTVLGPPMVTLVVDATFERGLLGVAAHPNFTGNGYIYLHYTTPQNGTHNRISRFTVNGNTAGNELVLVDLPQLGSGNHNGGAMHFGPDGKLFVAVGDNWVGANSQDLSTPLGKMLRFNDDGSIPDDNPFCTTQGNLACAVWALGLRNPFTFAIQPGTGRMHINDVGQEDWEEINLGVARANYGWPGTEGPTSAAGITAPLFAYSHSEASPPGTGAGGFFVGICIIGGDFYPSSGALPARWHGGYFFADLGSRFIGFIDLDNGNAAYAFGSVTINPVGLMVANDGAVLVLMQGEITRFAAQ